MIVSQILTEKGSQVYTVSKEVKISNISDILASKRIGAVVVVDKNGVVEGIISERDIVRGLANHGAGVLEISAAKLMTTNVITRGVDAHIDELMREMSNSRIRHLPIVDDGQLAGLISIGDVVKSRVGELEAEGDMLRDYITTG